MAIGDLVARLSVPGASGVIFTLLDNPGGFFSISGSAIVEAIDAPAGNYPISVQAAGPGFSIVQPAVLTFSGTDAPILDLSKPGNVELFPGAL